MWSIHTQTKLTSFQQINDFTLSIWNMNFSHHGAFLINWTLLCNGTWKQSAWQTRGHWPSKWAIKIENLRLTAPLPGKTCYVCQRCIIVPVGYQRPFVIRSLELLHYLVFNCSEAQARRSLDGNWLSLFPKNIYRVSKKTPHRKWRKTRH